MVVVPMVPQERKSKKFMTIHTLIYDIYDMHMRYNHIVTLYIYINMMYILIYCIMILKDKNKTRRKEVFLYTPVTNENYLKSLNHIYINM